VKQHVVREWEFSKAETVKITVTVVTPCSLTEIYRYLGGKYSRRHRGRYTAVCLDSAGFSETSIRTF